jgi:hypothetical protein
MRMKENNDILLLYTLPSITQISLININITISKSDAKSPALTN